MTTYFRHYRATLQHKLDKPFVHILFGARQTGKSTLVKSILPDHAVTLDLSNPAERARFAARPGLFIDLCKALPQREGGSVVFVDEAQTVPALFDAVQFLYDQDKGAYRFILCGSSARKLRTSGANLLPGRSIRHLLVPLVETEYQAPAAHRLPDGGRLFPVDSDAKPGQPGFPYRTLEDRMVFGDLPGIALLDDDQDKADVLKSYATAYLEEEIRREAIVKDWGFFLRFLHFAAAESGGIVNLASISRETGVSAPTIKSYYQLIEDMFIGFSVSAYSGSTRKGVLSSPRFFFFDAGVRNAAAHIPLARDTVNAIPGALFEHWVATQLHRVFSYRNDASLSYFRTADGAEIDFIVEAAGKLYPIEVKWTENPTARDTRHLVRFIAEHADRCPGGYLVSRCPHTLDLGKGITAIPWWSL